LLILNRESDLRVRKIAIISI